MQEIDALVEMSNRYGRSPEYVLAGGGNTSVKVGPVMYVKGSGTSLATIEAGDFVSMNRDALSRMLEAEYPDSDAEREAAALADLMAARLPENGEKRPSVETILHNLFPFKYVLHVHPTLVNGLTCAQDGEGAARRLLGYDFVWIPIYRPGYALAGLCAHEMEEYKKETGKECQMLLLQNHGIFIAADTVEEIDERMARVMNALKEAVKTSPDSDEETGISPNPDVAEHVARALPDGSSIAYVSGPTLLKYLESAEAFEPLAAPFTPDHIVYCKAEFVYAERPEDVAKAREDFIAKYGYEPRVICVKGEGAFCAAPTEAGAETILALFSDAVKIAEYSESFGGPLHMTEDLVNFIKNWEMEAYRASVARK